MMTSSWRREADRIKWARLRRERRGGRGGFSQPLGLLERLGVAEVEEIVDSVRVDPDRPPLRDSPIGGAASAAPVRHLDVPVSPLGLLPVLLLLLRRLRRRLRRSVVGHGEKVREREREREKGEGEEERLREETARFHMGREGRRGEATSRDVMMMECHCRVGPDWWCYDWWGQVLFSCFLANITEFTSVLLCLWKRWKMVQKVGM